jgi:rhodanese-related sulfurtransferase
MECFMKRRLFTVFWIVSVSSLMVSARASSEYDAERLAALGESLYLGHCGRCHGDDGDATGYYRIVPLAGIARRPPVGLVGRFRQESFSTRGVRFSGERARALWLHLARLSGGKRFPDPGWLWSPTLLERKTAEIEECRIVDVRRPADYSASHIPNAVSLDLGEGGMAEPVSAERVAALFRELGIGESTQVVIYDRRGGPEAAWIWWALVNAGHPYVTILDGGWEHWVARGFPVSRIVPRIATDGYSPAGRGEEAKTPTKGESVGEIDWDWRQLTGPEGLKDADAIRAYLESVGIDLDNAGFYRAKGSLAEGALLLFLARLFGMDGVVGCGGGPGLVRIDLRRN